VGARVVSRGLGFGSARLDAVPGGFADAQCDRLTVADSEFVGDAERYPA